MPYTDFLDNLGGSTRDILVDLQKSDYIDDSDSVYGREKSADVLVIKGDIGEKHSIMKRKGFVEPNNISDRNDIKEDLMEGSRSLSSVLANKESKLDVSRNNLKGPSPPF